MEALGCFCLNKIKIYDFIKLVCFTIAFFVNGCCFTQLKHLPEGGFRPKKPDFTFARAPYNNIENRQIDTCAIYISKSINDYPKEISGDTLYTFYRFFRNGRAYNSFTVVNHYPTNSDINNFRTGLIGYYKIENDNLLSEFFVPINGGQYRIKYNKIRGDSLVFLGQEINGRFYYNSPKSPPSVLVKVKEPWMKFEAQPDW